MYKWKNTKSVYLPSYYHGSEISRVLYLRWHILSVPIPISMHAFFVRLYKLCLRKQYAFLYIYICRHAIPNLRFGFAMKRDCKPDVIFGFHEKKKFQFFRRLSPIISKYSGTFEFVREQRVAETSWLSQLLTLFYLSHAIFCLSLYP